MKNRKLLADFTMDELLSMRDNGMSNRDIANTTGVSLATIYKHLGPQPAALRKPFAPSFKDSHSDEPGKAEDDVEAALVVDNQTIGLAGLYAGYRVDIRAKKVSIFVEDGVDVMTLSFDEAQTFAKELAAIARHVDSLRVGPEMW